MGTPIIDHGMTCSCFSRRSPCPHLLFVMCHVLRVSSTSKLLKASTLQNFEVETLLHTYGVWLKNRASSDVHLPQHPSTSTSNETAATENFMEGNDRHPAACEEVECSICIENLDATRQVSYCHACKKGTHTQCLAMWFEEAVNQEPACPLCRAKWPSHKNDTGNASIPHNAVNSIEEDSLHRVASERSIGEADLWRAVDGAPRRDGSKQTADSVFTRMANTFGESIACASMSADYSHRKAAMLLVGSLMGQLPVGQRPALFEAHCELLLLGVQDRVFQVFAAALPVVSGLVALHGIKAVTFGGSGPLTELAEGLLTRANDGNKRIREQAADALFALGHDPAFGEAALFRLLVKAPRGEHVAHSCDRTTSTHLGLVERLLGQFPVSVKGRAKRVRLEQLIALLSSLCTHRGENTRAATKRLAAMLYRWDPARMLAWGELLPPQQRRAFTSCFRQEEPSVQSARQLHGVAQDHSKQISRMGPSGEYVTAPCTTRSTKGDQSTANEGASSSTSECVPCSAAGSGSSSALCTPAGCAGTCEGSRGCGKETVSAWEVDCSALQTGAGRLGGGASGEVYCARWLGIRVAVKKIGHEVAEKEEIARAFRAEIDVMQRLRHPNVLLFMAACTNPDHLAIVTEFCPLGSVYDAIRRTVNARKSAVPSDPSAFLLTPKASLRIAQGAAAGMIYLHTAIPGCKPQICHGDLKSANILVDRQMSAKIADYGLSKLEGSNSRPTLGTVQWSAPEVLREEGITGKSDVYSFGVFLWELVTLQMPWDNCHPLQVVFNVGTQVQIHKAGRLFLKS
ncbi:hypothetical protein CYMTET_19587 [Cymbomonas tetramitiformis]|uniref:Uncharacterized protein n=1 Tax=Cymbomonas tetramitiformis TaxID=36881 RepID=A0AAE0L4Q7_9CHLO|nr:hypothetical protein CYMTET_19587 [Cymbomonas tetramitiformis]